MYKLNHCLTVTLSDIEKFHMVLLVRHTNSLSLSLSRYIYI